MGNPTIDYASLAKSLASAPADTLNTTIVESLFDDKISMAFLFLGFICLYIVDEKKDEIHLMAASGTEQYRLAIERYNFKPSEFHLHFDTDKNNTIVKAISSGKPQFTTDWLTLSRKHKSADVVRLNQANSGIAYTAVYPFTSKVRGALMYNFYQYPEQIGNIQHDFMKRYTKLASSYLSQPA